MQMASCLSCTGSIGWGDLFFCARDFYLQYESLVLEVGADVEAVRDCFPDGSAVVVGKGKEATTSGGYFG